MTQEEFDALVARLESEAAANPGMYRLKLGAFASLGYLYVLGVLALLAAAVGGLVLLLINSSSGAYAVGKLLIPLIVLIGVVLRSMWVKLEAPQGLALQRQAYPKLFAAIDKVRRASGAPRAEVVLLTNELNAAIVQVPQLGLFGWHKNYLILGLPLMQIMSPKEFLAVLAHEFGHLSGAHGRFGAWIYRVRAGWARLNERLQQEQHWGSFLFVPFFGWFAPKFAAWSFVQARQQEYEADRVAAAAMGPRSLANALIRLDLKARELEQHYWPGIYAKAKDEATPTPSPFSGLSLSAQTGFLPGAEEQLLQSLRRTTSTADTHPSLAERIDAVDQDATVPEPLAKSAAEVLFADRLADLAQHFDTEWRHAVAPWWSDRHAHVKNGREKLDALCVKPRDENSDDELFALAELTEELDSPEAALPIYKALAARETRPVGARYAVGRLLLERDDEKGMPIIREIMDEDEGAIMAGCQIIVAYLERQGRGDETGPYVDRYWAQQQKLAAADQARYGLNVKDDYEAASLSEESLTTIREALRENKSVKRAYAIRKVLPEDQPPLHVIGVEPKPSLARYRNRTADRELVKTLANTIRIADDVVFLPLNDANKRFKKVFKKIPGAEIYG